MHRQNLWQRWFGRSKQSRRPSTRCVVRGAEALERRELLSAVVGASTPDTLDAGLGQAAVLSDGGKAGGNAPGGGGGTTAAQYTYESLKAKLEAWEDIYGAKGPNGTLGPNLCDLVRIGGGAQNYNPAKADPSTYNPNDPRDVESTRGLWAIKISDNASSDEGLAEPDLKYIATMHGNEPLGMEMSMRFAEELLTKYSTDDSIKSFVDNNEIWVLPLMNPDGFANNQRTNYNGYDLNRSFPELVPLDPYATSKPALAALEANLPKDRKGNCLVPEVKAVMDWSAKHQFVLAANFHTGALLVNYPFDNDGTTTTAHYALSPDDGIYRQLANTYASAYNDKSPIDMTTTNGAAWFVITGGMQDFDYRYFGTKHVTIELYSGYGYGTKKNPIDLNEQWGYNRGAMLAYLQVGVVLVDPLHAAPTVGAAAVTLQQAAQPVVAESALLQSVAYSVELSGIDRSTGKRRSSVLLQDDLLRDWNWSPQSGDLAAADLAALSARR